MNAFMSRKLPLSIASQTPASSSSHLYLGAVSLKRVREYPDRGTLEGMQLSPAKEFRDIKRVNISTNFITNSLGNYHGHQDAASMVF